MPSAVKSHRSGQFSQETDPLSRPHPSLVSPADLCQTVSMKPTVNASEIVHQNPWYQVRHDTLTWPNGNPGHYYVVDFPECIVAIAEDAGRLLTVNFYRHPIGQYSHELPMGRIEPGESPEQAAFRELHEEGGIKANKMTKIGEMFIASGVMNNKMHVFVASELTPVAQDLDDGEQGMKAEWTTLADWTSKIRSGHINDCDSLAAWAIYQEWKNAQG